MPERQFITGVPGVKVQDVIKGNVFEIRGIAEITPCTVCVDRVFKRYFESRFESNWGFPGLRERFR